MTLFVISCIFTGVAALGLAAKMADLVTERFEDSDWEDRA
jgi:hypothetical protein